MALKVPSEEALLAAKAHVEAQGIDVLGPTHHGIFKSIYFFDPNGHRVELAADIVEHPQAIADSHPHDAGEVMAGRRRQQDAHADGQRLLDIKSWRG